MKSHGMHQCLIAGWLLLGCPLASNAQIMPSTPVVVELFTSQGCSSCPPADELLGELARRPNVVALAFHVDYWDSIGWRDPYSIPQSVVRQRGYVDTLGLSSAFTPQVIIDGRASFVGSDRRRIIAALDERGPTIQVTADVDQRVLTVTITGSDPGTGADVNAVAFLPHASTAVSRGENAGRRLTEYNIVRQLRRLGAWDGRTSIFRVPVETFPADATRVAILLQRPHQGPVIGSAVAVLRQATTAMAE